MEQEQKIRRLSGKPKYRGFWHIVFSRLPIILVLFVAQMFIPVILYARLRLYMSHYMVIVVLFTLGMTVYLFNCPMDSTGKLTWLALIAVLPLPGAFMLLFSQANLGHRTERDRVEGLINKTKDALEQDETALAALDGDPCGTDDLHRYLNRSGCFPVYARTEARYFGSGEEMFPAMLEELEKAEKFIFVEMFILEEGEMWGRILDILERKAAQGVEVRVLYDGMCEIFQLSHDYPRRLRSVGIKAKMFAPVTPFLSTHYNYRDHRKIIVIDGETAFTGGVNLADEYINRKARFGYWKDAALMARGPAAQSFTLMFLQMWNITEKEEDFSFCAMKGEDRPECGGVIIPYADCPLDGDKVGENVYIDLLYRAGSYVHIMTPYLILDGELENALRYAGERGIDVKLILPGIPDKPAAYALAKSHYASLIQAGVKIYEYTPGFVHAKVFVSDGIKATVGTINLDYRSLYHHFECAAYLYRADCIPDIEADFQNTLAQCREVTPESIRHEKLRYKLMGSLLKVIAPLM